MHEILASIRSTIESPADASRDPAYLWPARESIDVYKGLAIKIWADEHPPPHFHVAYQGQDASFSILDCTRLPGVKGLERHEQIIRDWWYRNRNLLIEKWNKSRPSDCPVGPILLP